jgi:adenosine deaminase
MPQANNSANAQLLKLEKLCNRIIRKSLKNNTLQYTVQISRSSEAPNGLKYSSFISSPNKGVQPIIFSFDSYELLEAALKQAEKDYNPKMVEIAFHEDRINTYEAQRKQHQDRIDQLNDPNYTEDVDPDADLDIEMEEV